MRTRVTIMTILLLGAAGLWGCRRPSAEERKQAEAQERAAQAMQQMAEAAGQDGAQFVEAMERMQEAAEAAGPVEPVDFRKLRETLPEAAGSARRTSAAGEKTGIGGFQVSRAEADYAVNGGSVRAVITDLGGTGTPAAMMMAAWTMAQIDRETESGYEKTSTINGHKAHEQYDNDAGSGSVEVLVGGRFLVELNGNQVSMEDIKGLLKHLDLDKLASMK